MAMNGSIQSLSILDQVRSLLQECEQGNVSHVERLLHEGVDVNGADEEGTTALQVAAANGHDQLVRTLLMRGAALDQANVSGFSPLLHAARHGHQSMVALLIQNKADINARNRLGASAISLASRGGHLQTCKLLLEAGIDLSSPGSFIGMTSYEYTPLMAAAQHGHDSVLRYLLDRGFDINYRTPSTGINALMLAAANGHMTTCQILIEREADPDLTNVNEHTPLEIATIHGKREVRGYLDRKTKNKPKISPEDVKPDVIEAARNGDIVRMRDILDEDLTQRDACSPQDGATPLMFAAMLGRLDMVQLLIDKGCDINKQDNVSGWTALMQATYHGKRMVAKYLVNAGADVLIPAKNGCTAFDMACLIDDVDTELYRLLAAKAVQVNRKSRGKTWSPKQNGNATSAAIEPGEEQPKTGLKAWWNRMSNRFRNLKLGRTFGMSPNRQMVAPLPLEPGMSNDDTLKRTHSNTITSSPKSQHNQKLKASISMDALNSTTSSNISYETIMLETKKSASMYTLSLGMHTPAAPMEDGTLKPVIPPFHPSPTFESNRPKMPPVSSRRPGATSTSPTPTRVQRPMKFLQMYASNQNLSTTSPTSPTPRQAFTNASPSSSGGASGISTMGRSRVASSASSSTLTAGSDTLNKSGAMSRTERTVSEPPLFTPVKSPAAASYSSQSASIATASTFLRSSHTGSSTTEGSGGRKRSHTTKSASSRDSTNSTLTPSPSPTPKPSGETSTPSSEGPASLLHSKPLAEEDELGGILKKLALEKYQPIFEDQEVDMEAFLTLTDVDLEDLGIKKAEPRRQILAAISELQSGKGRERLQFHETMSQFQNTISSRSSFSSSGGGAHASFPRWGMPTTEVAAPHTDSSAKSRAS